MICVQIIVLSAKSLKLNKNVANFGVELVPTSCAETALIHNQYLQSKPDPLWMCLFLKPDVKLSKVLLPQLTLYIYY